MVSYNAFFGVPKEGGCVFCPERRGELEYIIHEDEELLAIKDKALAGAEHWLIIPKKHIRDIEALTKADLGMVQNMLRLKEKILLERHPDVPRSEIHAGYHRGHRPLGGVVGSFGAPDIISVQHLHLHVIVQPYWYMRYLKYPNWFSPMWVSDVWLVEKLSREEDGEEGSVVVSA